MLNKRYIFFNDFLKCYLDVFIIHSYTTGYYRANEALGTKSSFH